MRLGLSEVATSRRPRSTSWTRSREEELEGAEEGIPAAQAETPEEKAASGELDVGGSIQAETAMMGRTDANGHGKEVGFRSGPG